MGVAVRTNGVDARKMQMAALSRALQRGLKRVQSAPASELIAALPRELTAGADMNELVTVVDRYRHSLYPTRVAIDVAACDRVAQSLKIGGLLKSNVKAESILDLSVTGS